VPRHHGVIRNIPKHERPVVRGWRIVRTERPPQERDRVAERGNLNVIGTVIAADPNRNRVCIRWDPTWWTAPPPMWQDTATLVVLSSPAV
jgi:hypothetical protein